MPGLRPGGDVNTDHLYVCGRCGTTFVVPTLARACEQAHRAAETHADPKDGR